jgi:CxxC-x17-CxxC domain-containing protein
MNGDNWKFTFFNYSSKQIEVNITFQKPMFEIKCTDCGNTAMVPFKPTAGKPAYCKTCFSKHRSNRPESGSKSFGFDPKQAWARRRNNGQERKEEKPTSIFHQS